MNITETPTFSSNLWAAEWQALTKGLTSLFNKSVTLNNYP